MKVGDKVRMGRGRDSEFEGVVVRMPNQNHACVVVEVTKPDHFQCHDCNGLVPSKKGIFILPESLSVIEEVTG